MTAHEIHALSGAYAVDALDDLERARFEAHLSACAECQAEVASLQAAAASISAAAEVAPPAELRAKILGEIKSVRPLPPVVARIEARKPRRWTNILAAAAVLGVVGAGTAVVQELRTDDPPAFTGTAADRVLKAADVKHWNVKFPSGASATVSRSESEGHAVLVARDMSAAPAGKVYQLWLLKDGRMVAAGTMHGGSTLSTVVLKGDANEATGAGITIEPDGGSTSPTTAPIAVFDFDKQQA